MEEWRSGGVEEWRNSLQAEDLAKVGRREEILDVGFWVLSEGLLWRIERV